MNPYILAASVVSVALAWAGGHRQGHSSGVDKQKTTNQAMFDKINMDLATQKEDAGKELARLWDSRLASYQQNDQLKKRMEITRATQQNEITRLRNLYSTSSLRFSSSAENAGCWPRSVPPGLPEGNTPNATPTVISQLPDSITRSLRQLTAEADELNANYKLCYDYLNREVK